MDLQPWLSLALAALGLFWVLGAHNRLVALRNAIGAAWSQLEQALQARGTAVEALTMVLRGPLADEAATLGAVQAAQAQLLARADALRARPALAERAASLAGAEATLGAALARLQALVELHPALRGDPAVAPHLAALRDSAPRLAFGRQLYNDAVRQFNLAAQQFPTRLVARLFGFGAAGTL